MLWAVTGACLSREQTRKDGSHLCFFNTSGKSSFQFLLGLKIEECGGLAKAKKHRKETESLIKRPGGEGRVSTGENTERAGDPRK